MPAIASLSAPIIATWTISLVAIACVLIRPKGLAEAWWSVAGAVLLVGAGLFSEKNALQAIGKGLDVYLFLLGMMITSELARREGVFEWIAVHAVTAAKGSRARLFGLIYVAGVLVTVLLSNDATAVVLTPAVQAAVRAAQAESLPYLLICAFVANAASFVLPISNPANLVVYSGGMPPLASWIVRFGLPSLASILVTFFVLRWLARNFLNGTMQTNIRDRALSPSGKLTLAGIGVLVMVLLCASAFGSKLGSPAFAASILLVTVIAVRDRRAYLDVAKGISWSVIPLVAGLFVIVEAMNEAGAREMVIAALQAMKAWPVANAALTSAFSLSIVVNLMNNLPVGLIAGNAVDVANVTGILRDTVLIGTDLGPNLSITGSLATILWLIAIRREGQQISFWKFLSYGIFIMPPALALAVLVLFVGR